MVTKQNHDQLNTMTTKNCIITENTRMNKHKNTTYWGLGLDITILACVLDCPSPLKRLRDFIIY